MGEITLYGMSAVVLIVAVVQGLKTLGLRDEWAPWATLVVAVLGAVAVQLLVYVPGAEPIIKTVVLAVVLFLGATGGYTVSKNVKESVVGY